uniref:Uncharacterized protein n=1 Tax=Arundo donax TaxID=35708 RepID=A0A0A9E5X9_ARUDO
MVSSSSCFSWRSVLCLMDFPASVLCKTENWWYHNLVPEPSTSERSMILPQEVFGADGLPASGNRNSNRESRHIRTPEEGMDEDGVTYAAKILKLFKLYNYAC